MRYLIFLFVMGFALSSCRVLNPSLMFKTKPDYKYAEFKDSIYKEKEYKISYNDQLEFQLFSNDGFKMIDLTSFAENSQWNTLRNSIQMVVEFDGNIKLPVLGRLKLQGMTLRQAELFLEEQYAIFYKNPFVLLKVTNRRVIIFPGAGGAASVISLSNNNTSLIEALALAGGITSEGKAYKIKLIRGNLNNPEIYKVDLSTIEGVKKADLIVQANDIIYIEPKLNLGRDVLNEISPFIGLLTSLLLVYGLFVKK